MERSKRFIGLSLVALLVLAVSVQAGEKKVTKRISFGGGNTTGIFYVIAGGIANLVNQADNGIEATIEVTGGSVENANLIADGEVEIAIMNTDVAMYSYTGVGPFSEANPNLRHIGKLHPSTMQIVATKSSGITSLEQMRGKRVAVGTPGASQRVYIEELFELSGMSFNDIITYDLNYGEAADQMKDGLMDVVFVLGGIPNATVVDLCFSMPVNLISIDDGLAAKLIERHAFFNPDIIPAGMYAENEAKTVGLMNSLACDAGVDDDVVYEVTRQLYGNLDYMATVHDICRAISVENAVSSHDQLFPMHPGALRYWKEIGAIK